MLKRCAKSQWNMRFESTKWKLTTQTTSIWGTSLNNKTNREHNQIVDQKSRRITSKKVDAQIVVKDKIDRIYRQIVVQELASNDVISKLSIKPLISHYLILSYHYLILCTQKCSPPPRRAWNRTQSHSPPLCERGSWSCAAALLEDHAHHELLSMLATKAAVIGILAPHMCKPGQHFRFNTESTMHYSCTIRQSFVNNVDKYS